MKILYAFAKVAVGIACLLVAQVALGQEAPSPSAPTVRQGSERLRLTLQDAIGRARANSTQFQAVVTNLGLTLENRTQARNALLPSVGYNSSVIYTQSTGLKNQINNPTLPPVVFIANNAVHEYIAQGDVHGEINAAAIASYRRSAAAAAVARAQVEIESRSLVSTVVSRYYSIEAAQEKLEAAKETAAEGDNFLKITQALERAGESAHSDVIKAELQTLDRKGQVQEAQLALLDARLDLAVLIFLDFSDNFDLVEGLHATRALPTLFEIQKRAVPNNPDVDASRAAVQVAKYDILGARAGYLPSLTFDYFYGIDAPNFAANSVVNGEKTSNLGYLFVGAANIPIWNWGSTQSRVNQAELQHSQAKRELSLAERKLLADIQSRYAEAELALKQLSDLNRSAELARESLRLTTLRYKNGEGKVIEVVDAENSFFSARAAYQDGAVRYHVAFAELQTLTGSFDTP